MRSIYGLHIDSSTLKPNIAPAVRYDGKLLTQEFMFKVGLALIPPLLLIFLVLGSIIAGIATVNQAGAIGAIGAMVMAGYKLRRNKNSVLSCYFSRSINFVDLVHFS